MITSHHRAFRAAVALTAIVTASLLSGCLLIRTTEHRIQLNADGSGEALLRLIDIRSDALTDSAATYDFAVMMTSFQGSGVKEFESTGRKVTGKRMFVRGDTLNAEITYTFPAIDAVEVLRKTNDEIFVVVEAEREILRTNGKVVAGEGHARRIVWKPNAERLSYVIRERVLPASVSLAGRYRVYEQKGGL
jgi:hypothetical protein